MTKTMNYTLTAIKSTLILLLLAFVGGARAEGAVPDDNAENIDYSNVQFEVNLENDSARKYLAEVTYEDRYEIKFIKYNWWSSDGYYDPNPSQILKYYVPHSFKDYGIRYDIPAPAVIPVPPFTGDNATLEVRDADNQVVATRTITPGQSKDSVYNLIPQQTYTYDIMQGSTNLSHGTFNTTGHLRMIHIPTAYNIRDLGGWETQDGNRVKYGHLFRGTALYCDIINCTPEDRQKLKDLGVGGEIDLRFKQEPKQFDHDGGCGTCIFGFSNDHYYFANAKDNDAACFSDDSTKKRFREEFEFVVNHFRQNKAVYFHCTWGADRTGNLAFLLEGILGVTPDQIYKDYELTTFSAAPTPDYEWSWRPEPSKREMAKFSSTMNVILDLEGATVRDKFENYYLNQLGVSMEDIVYYRSVMLDKCPLTLEEAINNSTTITENKDKICEVTLSGRTLYKNGEWNTICLPFKQPLAGSPLAGATAKTLTGATLNGNTVTLTFGDAVETLEAGVPYLIKWDKAEGYDEADPEVRDIKNPVFPGVAIVNKTEAERTISMADGHVKFIGYYDAFDINEGNEDIYYLTAGNKLKHTGVDRTLKACRAYFQFTSDAAARKLAFNFGDEATGLKAIDNGQWTIDNGQSSMVNGYYDLQGRRLSGEPTRRGIYVRSTPGQLQGKKSRRLVIK